MPTSRPAASPPDLGSRILEALRAAGGSAQRSNLRDGLRPVVRTAAFDVAIAELLSKDLISSERPVLYWRSPSGKDVPYQATIYTLAKRKKRKA